MINAIKTILSPSVILYSLVIKVRNGFFNKGIFRSKKVNAKIISIGNITVGGSGKTPAVIMTSRILKEAGKKVGVLSRGYGRKSSGYQLVYDGKSGILPVDQSGDEMFLVVDELKIPGAVSEKRVDGANSFLKDVDLDVIVLDDAFQHRWIARDIDILMFDQRFLLKNPFIHHHQLPLGILREPFSSVKRSDIIIINRKFSEKQEIPAKILKHFKQQNIYYGHYEAVGIFDVKTHQHFDLNEFKGQKSLVVCGIARPFSFIKLLEENSIDVKNKMIFTDHQDYSEKEVHSIRKSFYDTNSYSVLTTQKDAVKLANFSREFDDIDIYYVKIELKLDEENKFKEEVLKIFN